MKTTFTIEVEFEGVEEASVAAALGAVLASSRTRLELEDVGEIRVVGKCQTLIKGRKHKRA